MLKPASIVLVCSTLLFVAMTESLLSTPVSSTPLNREDVFDLLCACATANPSAGQIARIQSAVHSVFADSEQRTTKSDQRTTNSDPRTANDENWREFLRLAEHHGVLPLVARNLITHARGLPPEIEQSLRSSYEANLRRNLWFAAELIRILRHFEQRQLRALPFKGPVLAQSAYGDLGLRSFSDLDLLISPADFAQAKHALGQMGYLPSKETPPAVERLWLRNGYERSFDGPAAKNLLELQWNSLPYFYAVDFRVGDFRFDDLMARARRIALGPADVPCLSAEDSLLVQCLHAAKHLWTRLIWVTDIAESLRAPGIDFAVVLSRARDLGIARILAVSLWLVESLLGVDIPAARALLQHDSAVPRLGKECAARLSNAETYNLESTAYFLHILKLRDRRRDRWRYLWRLTFTPGPGDVSALPLPEPLFPLYRIVRIGRLLGKLI